MNLNRVTSNDVISWIEKSLDGQNFNTYEINLTGKSEKCDGYMGEVVFATVDGSTKDNERKVLNLVIKHAKKNDYLRKAVPVKSAFEKEIHLYEKVFPVFKEFQLEKTLKTSFDSVPRCYKTLVVENMEVLVLDNLKALGYELHDRKKPLNLHHLKVIATEYAKFHALSFALKDQEKETFNSLVGGINDTFERLMLDKGVQESTQQSIDDVLDMLRERNNVTLFNKFKNLLVKKPSQMLLDLLDEKETQSVIIHGDCWNNNFMFKYENANRISPSKIAILDWQLSSFRSPAFDLAYLVYANSSKEELDKFDEIIDIYYASFSNFLRELGSNPEELFTLSDLKRHWKKYSLFGLLFMPMLLRFALCDKDEAPALEDLQEGSNMGSVMLVNIADKEAFYERLEAIISHYFNYVV